MKILHKIANLALIFTLIGIFLSAEAGYSLSQATLRVPLISKDTKTDKRTDTATKIYSETELKKLVVENVKVLREFPWQHKITLIMLAMGNYSLSDIAFKLRKPQLSVVRKSRIPLPVIRQYEIVGYRNLQELLDPNSDYQPVVNNPEPLKILTMLFIEGKSPSKIARELNISQEIVSQYKRADFRRLKKLVGVNSSRQLVGLLKMLSEQQKKVVIMFFIERKSPSEIAEELVISQSTVSTHKQDGISKLKELAEQRQLIVDNPKLFKKFSKRQQQVLIMFFIEGKRISEIAEELGIGQSTVRVHKQAGLNELRKLVNQKQLVVNNLRLNKQLGYNI